MIRGGAAAAAGAHVLDLDGLARLVLQLAVLLGAGVAPLRAWAHAARATSSEVAAEIVRAGPDGIPDAIASVGRDARAARRGWPVVRRRRDRASPAVSAAWSGLAAAWTVSTEAGAALAPTLRAYAELLRGFAAAERRTRVALAGPRATTRLVLVLPLVAIAFGALLGQDTIGVLVGTPIGWGCLVTGAGLMLAGWAWSGRLLRKASSGDAMPGLVEELTAVAMGGGVSVPRARRIVVAALERHGLAADPAAADAALELAAASGAPAGELLRAEAEERRRAAVAVAEERAERLAVTLMLPLGVCVLPAFVAVGVVPMMTAVIGATISNV